VCFAAAPAGAESDVRVEIPTPPAFWPSDHRRDVSSDSKRLARIEKPRQAIKVLAWITVVIRLV
jgi:hypothetical protein